MSMKVAGYTLLWIGVMALLKNLGVIRVLDWSIIWPVVLIVAGLSLKHYKHSMYCLMGGACGTCGRDHKCGGDACKVCK